MCAALLARAWETGTHLLPFRCTPCSNISKFSLIPLQKFKLDKLVQYDTLYWPQVLVMTAVWVGAVSTPRVLLPNTLLPPLLL